jgi:hypothetical protein
VRNFVIPFYYGSGSGFGSETVINYGSGSDFLARYGSGSAFQKVTVPVPVVKKLRFLRFQFQNAALDNDHVGDLDDGVLVGLGEDALAAGALDVEGEDAERRHLGPVALGGVGDQPVPGHVNFHL